MRTSFMVFAALLAAFCIDSGCAGKSPASPDGTTATNTSSSSCRTYAASATGVSTAGGYTINTSTTCTFNTATIQLSCTYRTSDTNGATSASTGIMTYASVGDFVSEVQVVPPLRRSLRVTTSNTPSGPPDVTLINAYDGQNRLTQDVQTSSSGTVTSRYTSWDSAGRPIAGTIAYPTGETATVVWSHNDGTRATTMTSTISGLQVVTTSTFDANGNPASVSSSGVVATTTTTATDRVCR